MTICSRYSGGIGSVSNSPQAVVGKEIAQGVPAYQLDSFMAQLWLGDDGELAQILLKLLYL